ncbi:MULTISPECIES: hypothetical protein [unclassified Streptosporangium]|uniref:hypothetical protein n=1 Tax=unclassified Streptosporangium TaxID=2632669 RepID=UPI002E2D55E9|nr:MULTISPECIES: hypothetical protein [unclassified Streptosporangium]
MTITESELREILNGDEDEGHSRGVAIAGVHRRVRAIRRRRRWTVGGAVAAALTVAVALNTPAGGVTDDLDVWTGVMARPSPTMPITSQPQGAPFAGSKIAGRDYDAGGTREELRFGPVSGSYAVGVSCSGPMRRVIVWIDGEAPQKRFCGAGPRGYQMDMFMSEWSIPASGKGKETVFAAILPGELDAGGRDIDELLLNVDDLFDGWEERLAKAESFPLDWSVTVRQMLPPPCRDGLRQVDRHTGKVVELDCAVNDVATPLDPLNRP